MRYEIGQMRRKKQDEAFRDAIKDDDDIKDDDHDLDFKYDSDEVDVMEFNNIEEYYAYLDGKYERGEILPRVAEEPEEKKEKIKVYHNADAEYEEKKIYRRNLDNYLGLFGFTFSQFTDGEIPDAIICNLSASLAHETGKPLGHYARLFKCEHKYAYDALMNISEYKSF